VHNGQTRGYALTVEPLRTVVCRYHGNSCAYMITRNQNEAK